MVAMDEAASKLNLAQASNVDLIKLGILHDDLFYTNRYTQTILMATGNDVAHRDLSTFDATKTAYKGLSIEDKRRAVYGYHNYELGTQLIVANVNNEKGLLSLAFQPTKEKPYRAETDPPTAYFFNKVATNNPGIYSRDPANIHSGEVLGRIGALGEPARTAYADIHASTLRPAVPGETGFLVASSGVQSSPEKRQTGGLQALRPEQAKIARVARAVKKTPPPSVRPSVSHQQARP